MQSLSSQFFLDSPPNSSTWHSIQISSTYKIQYLEAKCVLRGSSSQPLINFQKTSAFLSLQFLSLSFHAPSPCFRNNFITRPTRKNRIPSATTSISYFPLNVETVNRTGPLKSLLFSLSRGCATKREVLERVRRHGPLRQLLTK